jgi:cytidylate kinase
LSRRGLVIAIDGPSGAGKSTAGRALARRLGYTFVDTGAMYRALALKALQAGIALDSAETVAEVAASTHIELAQGGRRVVLDSEDVTEAIRSEEVSAAASRVSVHARVRRDMVARQQQLGGRGGVVLDGRDIGTVVFPDADIKFYLDAEPGLRAQRRHQELQAAGKPTDLAAVGQEIHERDRLDVSRTESPLTCAQDAERLDTTHMSPEEVVERMLGLVEARQGRSAPR